MDHTTPPAAPSAASAPPDPPKEVTAPPNAPKEAAAPPAAPKEVASPNTKHQTPNTETQGAHAPHSAIRYATPFRVLLIVVVMFSSLFLFLRTLAVEPFGVPTGSMAPALIGHHRDGPCPRCGYMARIGRPSGS